MQVIYAGETVPDTFSKSIFLVGPTPRDQHTPSWRPDALKILESKGFDGVVFVPEPKTGIWNNNYDGQIKWEQDCLNMSDLVIAWIPRDLDTFPAFTTNVEFGMLVNSGKLIYGRPVDAPKCGYLDYTYENITHNTPHTSLECILNFAVVKLGEGAERTGGERNVPLMIWNTTAFQHWIKNQKEVENRLDGATVEWIFIIPKKEIVFSFILKVNVWIEYENRHKSNEFIFTRSDTVAVLPYYIEHEHVHLSKLYLVSEFRSPVNNKLGMVYELPGGSSFNVNKSPLEVARKELHEEMGLDVHSDRLEYIGERQIAATALTHTCTLFSLELTETEMNHLDELSNNQETFGDTDSSEQTKIVKIYVDELFTANSPLDWANIGMISQIITPILEDL